MKLLAFFCAVALAQMAFAANDSSLYNIPIKDLDGKDTSLKAFEGKTILLVNVASKCGYTPQYKGLEAIYRKYKDKGLVVVGVPSNDFGAQEPGTSQEIKEFCSTQFNVTFPLMEKVHVKGAEQHPLYTALTGKNSIAPGDVSWNFNKFLISPDGKLIKRFDSKVTPESKELTGAIEANLPKRG